MLHPKYFNIFSIPIRKTAFLLLFTILLFFSFSARADQYDLMRQRIVDRWLLGTSFDTSDPDILHFVSALDDSTAYCWQHMEKSPDKKHFLWAQYPRLLHEEGYTPENQLKKNLLYLRFMAKSWSCPISKYYHNHALLTDIIRGLDFLYDYALNENTPPQGGWYNWRIGIPEYYGNIITLIYDSIPARNIEQYRRTVMMLIENDVEHGNLTFANKANVCQEMIVLGVLTRDSNAIMSGLNNSIQVYVDNTTVQQRQLAQKSFERCAETQGNYREHKVLKKEGLYPDGTFIQHIAIPYMGAYGLEILEYAAFVAIVLENSGFSIPQPIVQSFPSWFARTTLPIIYKGENLLAFMGRNTHKNPFDMGVASLLYMYDATQYAITDSIQKNLILAELKKQVSMPLPLKYGLHYSGLNPMAVKPRLQALEQQECTIEPDSVFSLYYPSSDRIIHQTEKYCFVVAMSSSRIGKFESINGENTRGWFQGDGMTYLYLPNDRDHYSRFYFEDIDWQRLPGTTVDTRKREPETNNFGLFGIPPYCKSDVGGLTLEKRGMAAMHLVGEGNTLEARKAWFLLDDEVLCLGTGISMSEKRDVETIVENRYTKEKIRLNKKSKVAYLPSVGGYVFPNKTKISVRNKKHYSKLIINHGKAPQNQTYAYVILPTMTYDQTKNYAANPQVEILANDTNIQAVRYKDLLAMKFWHEGRLGDISVDAPACVMQSADENNMKIVICEPTQKRENLSITINGIWHCTTYTDNLFDVEYKNNETKIIYHCSDRMGQSLQLQLYKTPK